MAFGRFVVPTVGTAFSAAQTIAMNYGYFYRR